MSKFHEVTVDGCSFAAQHGENLLDAALRSGSELPFDCRSGYCGTCCVRLVSGEVDGGQGAEAGVVHACQCRVIDDVVVERRPQFSARSVGGELVSLRPLSGDTIEAQIRPTDPLPHHPGQYAQVGFGGFADRPFSMTQSMFADPDGNSLYFHIRPRREGSVTRALGRRIRPGHRVRVRGPFGRAYFRANGNSRLVLVGTSTGFAPIWAIAVAALRENPARMMMVIAGARSMHSLYMAPALTRLARFPNVHVLQVCSGPQLLSAQLLRGRPTDFMPRLLPSDEVYACGAPAMVDGVRSITAHYGATCYADPFLPAQEGRAEDGVMAAAKSLFAGFGRLRLRMQFNSRPAPQAAQGHFQEHHSGALSHSRS